MENNLENKAKFFALYLGQTLIVSEKPKQGYYPFDMNECCLKLDGVLKNKIIVHRIAEQVEDIFQQCSLQLKPLSSITDEHALHLSKKNLSLDDKGYFIFNPHSSSDEDKHKAIRYIKNNMTFAISNDIDNADYLRSKGYALPFMGITVEKLIEYGWVKLKDNA